MSKNRSSNRSVCSVFLDQSHSTWTWLRRARKEDHPIGEETLTDLILLKLKEIHSKDIKVFSKSKKVERQEGADWEWWLTNGVDKWLGFRLQAKRLSWKDAAGNPRYSYEELHYCPRPSKTQPNPTFQADTLIYQALNSTPPFIPLYCLYSNWDTKATTPANTRGSSTSYGCSLMSAFVVPALRKSGKVKDLKSVLSYSRPWHELLCSPTTAANQSLPERALAYWQSNIVGSESQILSAFPISDLLPDYDSLRRTYETITVTGEPPEYARSLLENQDADLPEDSPRHLSVFVETQALESPNPAQSEHSPRRKRQEYKQSKLFD